MKKLEAIIRPSNLEELKDALLKANVNGLTISQVLGCGTQHGWTEHVRGSEIIMNCLQKIKVSMVVPDDRMEEIIDLITSIAQSGEVGDGKIFITDVADCVRIRTGERGDVAL
jgi:nitrogen regulatory protein P-II 1